MGVYQKPCIHIVCLHALLYTFISFLFYSTGNHTTVVCMCVNECSLNVLNRVISKPELSQVETLLCLRPPGINFFVKMLLCICMHAFVCMPGPHCNQMSRYVCAYSWIPVCFSKSACVLVCLCVLACGRHSIPHPAVYRREWKVMEGMGRDGPVMT